MPEPRISAIMNNCLLHSITPELVLIIQQISQSNQPTPGYDLLKQLFVEFYQIKDNFSWQDFSNLLNHYNPFDRQILFGPVLREYMAEILETCEEGILDGRTKKQFNSEFLTLGDNGRYATLDPFATFHLVIKHLEIGMTVERHGIQRYISDETKHIIALKYVGADDFSYHFERSIEDIIDYSEQPDCKLAFITKHIEEDKDNTLFMLDLIKQHVRALLAGPTDFSEVYLHLQEQLQHFDEHNKIMLQMIGNGLKLESARAFAHYSLSKDLLKPDVLSKEFREQIVLDLHKRLNAHVLQRYSLQESLQIKPLVTNFIVQLRQQLLNKPSDISIDEIKALFLIELQNFNEATEEYKNLFEIILDALIYLFKTLFGCSEKSFSLKHSFFDKSDNLETYFPEPQLRHL